MAICRDRGGRNFIGRRVLEGKAPDAVARFIFSTAIPSSTCVADGRQTTLAFA